MIDLDAIKRHRVLWTPDDGTSLPTICTHVDALLAEVERLRYLLKMASGVELRGLASGFVFSQRGDLYAHKFRHEYSDEAACGYRSRGPYQPLREEDLTCPDCIDVIRAVELASENPERGEHRREETK